MKETMAIKNYEKAKERLAHFGLKVECNSGCFSVYNAKDNQENDQPKMWRNYYTTEALMAYADALDDVISGVINKFHLD